MTKRKTYTSAIKLEVVKDMLRGEKTIEQICIKQGVSRSAVHKWKRQFDKNAHMIFELPKATKPREKESPEYLTAVIGKLTVENDILKKALGVWE